MKRGKRRKHACSRDEAASRTAGDERQHGKHHGFDLQKRRGTQAQTENLEAAPGSQRRKRGAAEQHLKDRNVSGHEHPSDGVKPSRDDRRQQQPLRAPIEQTNEQERG